MSVSFSPCRFKWKQAEKCRESYEGYDDWMTSENTVF